MRQRHLLCNGLTLPRSRWRRVSPLSRFRKGSVKESFNRIGCNIGFIHAATVEFCSPPSDFSPGDSPIVDRLTLHVWSSQKPSARVFAFAFHPQSRICETRRGCLHCCETENSIKFASQTNRTAEYVSQNRSATNAE